MRKFASWNILIRIIRFILLLELFEVMFSGDIIREDLELWKCGRVLATVKSPFMKILIKFDDGTKCDIMYVQTPNPQNFHPQFLGEFSSFRRYINPTNSTIGTTGMPIYFIIYGIRGPEFLLI